MAPGRATAIHLIENDGRIRPIDVSADLDESGFWVVGDDVAAERSPATTAHGTGAHQSG